MSTRRWFGAVGLATIVLAAASCGTGSSSNAGPNVVVRNGAKLVAATADATTKAKTAKVALNATMYGGAMQKNVSIEMDGALAFDGSAADFTMDLSSIVPNAPSGARIEARLVDGVMYMDMGSMMRAIGGQAGSSLPSGFGNLHWVKLDMSGATGGASSSPSQYTQYLEYLRGASGGKVDTIGHEKVRGVDTTHYHAEIPWDTVVKKAEENLDKASPAMRASLQKAIDLMQSTRDPVVADVWIDAQGMTRRLEMRMPFNIAATLGNVTMKMTMELYDFGTTLDVQAPPASQTTDLSQFAGLGGTSA
jgi:hypothetical protein